MKDQNDPTVHFYDESRMNELKVELAKLGNEALNDNFKGTAQDAIAEMRRGINDLGTRAMQLSNAGDFDGSERMLKAAETAGSVISRWQRDEKNKAESAQLNGVGRGGEAQLLKPNESFAKYSSRNEPPPQYGIGDMLANMAGARNNRDVKAALSENIDSAGGLSVPKILLDQIIDRMRSQMVVMQSGALTQRLETDQSSMLKIKSDPTVYWHEENATIPESDPSFDALIFKPKTAVCLIRVSRELMADAQNLNTALELAISASMGEAMDQALLYGTGTNAQPLGLANHEGLLSVDVGGQYQDFSKPLEAILKLRQANVWSDTQLTMIQNPLGWSQLEGLTSNEAQPLRPPRAVEDVRMLTSTAIPADQSIIGDFRKLVVGLRDQMRIEILNQAFASNYQIAFLASMRVCVGVMHPSAFCKLENISAPSTAKAK